jgi:SAM-dependent methyltransferase
MTATSTNATGSSGVWQLFRERMTRDAIYGVSSYWDARASARTGMARSLWPSNTFNAVWDERQRQIVSRSLGSMRGRRVVDVGCGTGRIVRWLAEECGAGAVVGLDFSAATIDAARAESPALVSSGVVRFEQGDILAGLVRKGGRVLLLEPIHRSPLLRRVLDLGVEEWIACANAAGLALTRADRMGFAPVRLVFAVRDLPRAVVGPVFGAGEQLLDRAPWLAPLSDYKLLLFTRAA